MLWEHLLIGCWPNDGMSKENLRFDDQSKLNKLTSVFMHLSCY